MLLAFGFLDTEQVMKSVVNLFGLPSAARQVGLMHSDH